MENKPEGFDRANGQGLNHDTAGNVANVDNDTLKRDDDDDNKDLAKEIPTVTPENDNEGVDVDDDAQQPAQSEGQTASNKGQGPSGENL